MAVESILLLVETPRGTSSPFPRFVRPLAGLDLKVDRAALSSPGPNEDMKSREAGGAPAAGLFGMVFA